MVYKKLQKLELRLHHIVHLYNVFRENDGKENCAQVLEEECIKMFGTSSLDDEHDCNVFSINTLNIHDANDMQRHNLVDAMFDEDYIFLPHILMSKFIMMKACLLSMMIIVMTCIL